MNRQHRPRRPTALVMLALLAMGVLWPATPASADGVDAIGGGGLPGPYQKQDPESTTTYRIRLGYWIPLFDFQFAKDNAGGLGTRIDDDNDLSANYAYVLPTFEVDFEIDPYGRLEFQFMNLLFEGDDTTRGQLVFGDLDIPANQSLDSEFEYRTLSLYGTVFVPLTDFITGGIVVGTRYAHFYAEIEADATGLDDDDKVDALFPVIGGSLEGEIYDPLYFYGRIMWLDFTYGDNDVEVSYREWQAGISLKVSDYFFVNLEWFDLAFDLEDGGSDYRIKFRGPRIQAQISF